VKAVIAVASLVLIIAACGGQRPSAYARRDLRAEEILMLDGKIMDYRRDMGLSPRPDPFLVSQERGRPPVVAPPPTPQSNTEQCLDVCELSAYICKASEDICRIADELGRDEWASAKCASAKASCKEARTRCTGCQ
jgi:hypothetical protein